MPGLGDRAASVLLLVTSVVALDRNDRVHEHERREDQRLDEIEEALEQEHCRRNDRDGERRNDAKGHLATEDVAEETHRERDGLDELEHELDEPDEQTDGARADAIPEGPEWEELREVAPNPETPKALELEVREDH